MGWIATAATAFADRYQVLQERAFDWRFGIDTCALQGSEHPGSPLIFPHAAGYQPVSPAMFRAIVRAAAIDPAAYTFIDYGSGKGRALVLAAEAGFRRAIGIEIIPGLHDAACTNLGIYLRRRPAAAPLEAYCGDAVEFPLPEAAVFLFFYNPFGEPVLRRVWRNVAAAWGRQPRPLVVAYRNPRHASVFDEAPFLRIVERNRSFALYRAASG